MQRTMPIYLTALVLGALGPAVCGAQQRLPEEMTALVNAYSIGKLNAAHLQDVCRWAGARQGANPSMTQVRTQNVAFCDGFLAATLEFAQLDATAVQTATTRTGQVLSCSNLPVGAMRAQLMTSPALRKMQAAPASEFLLATLLTCTR